MPEDTTGSAGLVLHETIWSRSIPFLKWLAELFSKVQHYFPMTQTSHHKSENTIIDDLELSPEAAVWHHALDNVIKLIVPLPCQVPVPCQGGYIEYKKLADLAVDKDGIKRICSSKDPMVVAQKLRDLTLKRFEAFRDLHNLQNSIQGPLMQDAKDKGIGHMILEEVQLEDPSNRYAPAYPTHRPAGAMLVNLAVLPEHAATVYSKYFAPFSSNDPLVCSEPGNDINLKRARAFRKIISRYDKAQRIQQSQGQIPGPKNELIYNWFSKHMTELKGRIKVIYSCKTIYVWCHTSIQSNGLHNMVRAAVAKDKTVHPDGAILVDLAVYKEGVRTVLHKYRVIDFILMSDDDPVVLSQPSETIEDKQVAAYKNMLKSPIAKVWVAEKLAGIKNQLSVIHPNHLEEIIQKLGLGDIIREAVPLKVQTIFQESVQVNLAVEPSGISRVRALCEVVKFQKLNGDPHIRTFNRYNHILQQFQEARGLR
ncbi:uncharacterized protein P174DRAFT_464815 [Aspergillus novofumigatus IBT 16806]|uniref:Uncharacterized protein n=1 Tax=Aspergillus novofumigatus (strain IBT 16806) TaxID=1392255 RepID=A0A2I1BUR6_ASPN1|nr:uncharacterized protein P174DRAFT_464815 [Aspergillus novofumigatus IBT 16806]PKX89109.1 hypothetical protein P174DRAFT_464815 [Aspergillus novofumigatus IBT 16806]